MTTTELPAVQRRRGRGARERILATATRLFWAQGINATGIEQLATEAQVSKRTVYSHFAGKDDLVTAYLQHVRDDLPLPSTMLALTELPARERLLGIFSTEYGEATGHRGCAFLNASVELPDPAHPAHLLAKRVKLEFAQLLADVAREAGARDPQLLGEQLALLWDGAAARGIALESAEPARVARGIAADLIDSAID